MKKPINEIERLKLIAGLINEIDYNDAVYGVKRNVLTEGKKKKEVKELNIDTANPYEYRHGLQHELEQLDEYTDEALEKAKATVLKNLAKDANFYSNLLNAKVSPFEFKKSETDAPGMQAKADGHLKKELKKDEKANVQDSLGKKEEGSKKPKGIKVMPDKGVTGSEKTIKESIEEAKKLVSKEDKIAVIKEWIWFTCDEGTAKEDIDKYNKMVDMYFADKNDVTKEDFQKIWGKVTEKYGVGDVGADWEAFPETWKDVQTGTLVNETEKIEEDIQTSNPEGEFNALLSKYDWYYEMSDDPRTYDRGTELDKKLRVLGKQIGVDKAVELFNTKAPSDRKVTSTFFMEGKDKLSKIKEALKKALRKEAGEKTAFVTTQGGDTTAVDYKTPEELRKIGDNTDVKRLKTGDGKTIKGS